MTAASAVVPSSYQELGELYGDDIRRAVRRCLPWMPREDREDEVQYILHRFLVRDVIREFDPEYVNTRPGYEGKPANFRSFILGRVPVYCRGRSEAYLKHYGRELCIADVSTGEDGRGGSWIEGVTAGDGLDDYPSLADEEVLARLRRRLAARPVPEGQPGLLALFDDLARRWEGGLPLDQGLARRFKMDQATADTRLAELRAELRAAVGGRVPEPEPEIVCELAGIKLTADQVAAAVQALIAAPGNQVVKYWRQAGHPLAGAGKDWYVLWAKQELEWYPHLRGAKGGHYEGGHGSPVKRGLIHRLERLLTDVPDGPDPDPPESPVTWLDKAEAALWGAPGATAAKVDEALRQLGKVFG